MELRRRQEETYLPLIDARRGRRTSDQHGEAEPPAYVDMLVDLRVPDDEQRRGSSSKRRRKRKRSVTNQMLKYD